MAGRTPGMHRGDDGSAPIRRRLSVAEAAALDRMRDELDARHETALRRRRRQGRPLDRP
jgi:hypothetical protein